MWLITWRSLLPTGKMDWQWLLKCFCMMLTESGEHLPSRFLTTERVTWDKGSVYKWGEGKWVFPQPMCDGSNRSVLSREILQRYGVSDSTDLHWRCCVYKSKRQKTQWKIAHTISWLSQRLILVELMSSEERKQDFKKIKKIRCWSRKWRKPKAE